MVDLTDTRVAESIAAWLNSGIDVVPPAQNQDAVKSEPRKETKADPQQEPFAFITGTTLTCTPISLEEKKRTFLKDGEKVTQPFIKAFFKGNVDGVSEASCFDTKLFEALLAGNHVECQFKVEVKTKDGKNYINIKDVLYIGPQYYEFGQPAQVGTVKENPDAEPD